MDGPSLLTSWTFDPLQLAPIVLIGVAYTLRARTLARRGRPVPRWRIGVFATGLGLLVLAYASPIATLGEETLFTAHMLQHIVLGDLAPLCLLAGLSGPLLQPVLAVLPVRRLRILANPFVALPVWVLASFVWFVPVLFDAVVENSLVHALFHVSLLTAGFMLWLPVIETLPAPEWFHSGAKLLYIAASRMIVMVVANVFVWATEPIYAVYDDGDGAYGIPPLGDQQLAGGLMMTYDTLLLLGAGAWLFLRMAQEGEVRQNLIEQGVDERTAKRAVRYRRWSELT